ncbi:hypothetical protein [Polyangium fumosum]|uniref:Uncharacterized protein n=1 Tax=Polyangium fumosum TaxID=889272 RepID=A0A4U1IZ54_9BACT|nr:hypothetical protein [Polyangium fumosum]TKC99860.1 hypothetical protein E8A74_36205 [Polyangium fumosum]
MPNAITLSYETDEETSGAPEEETATPFDDDTGGFFDSLVSGGGQLLSSILGGGGGAKPGGGGGGIGESIGAIAGAGLGTLAGGAGASIGANIGKMAGGAVESLVRTQVGKKKPPKKSRPGKPQRQLTKRERKILADGEQMTKRTGDPMYVHEARLRVYRPAEYKRKRDAGQLLSQIMATDPETEALPEPPQPQRPRLNFGALMASPQLDEPEVTYNDTASPDARPRPLQHVSASPMSAAQLEAMIRAVPLLRMHDPRLLRTLTGGGGARDVSGVDPTTGTYHAVPGETPHGITKKLTGQTERTQELLAANPGKPASEPAWNIPPGWLHYSGDTGAVLNTARKYVVIKDDWPQKIATKLGAFPTRAKWWSELRAANPHKATENGNWKYLYPGEEIGIPNEWPEHALAVTVNGNPAQPSTPGVPTPGKTTTLDPAVVPHTQALLANWALRNSNDCNPSDFGRNPMDLVSGFTPRTTQALASFQTWWNKRQPTRPLSTTGELDQTTYNALIEENNAQFTSPQQTGPQQTSTQSQQLPAPQQQQTENGTPAITIPGIGTFPLPNLGTPSTSTTTSQTPTQTQQQPAPQQTDHGTPVITIPGVGTFPLPNLGTPSTTSTTTTPTQQQPAPQQQQTDHGTPVITIPGVGTFALPNLGTPSTSTTTSQTPTQTQQQQPGPQQQTNQGTPVITIPGVGTFPLPNLGTSATTPTSTTTSQQPSGSGGTAQQTSPGQPTGSGGTAPLLDNDLSASEKNEIILVLESVYDANLLEQLASTYESQGHPLAAKALRARADALRELAAQGELGPEDWSGSGGSGGWQYGPVDAPATTSSSNSSLMPVIAVIGVGLAFS